MSEVRRSGQLGAEELELKWWAKALIWAVLLLALPWAMVPFVWYSDLVQSVVN